MSLRIFHIFFITISVLFSVGFGWWGLRAYFQETDRVLMLYLGVASLVVGAVLIIYGVKVFQKLMRL
ncbi:MAG: hypothetical protein ACE5LH_03055 [Fidelibacterota bacterium]